MPHRFSVVIFCVSIPLFAPALLFGEDTPPAASPDPVVLRGDFADSDALGTDAADGSAALAARLKRLDPNGPIWITPDRGEVLLLGTICLRQGLLEFFACGKNSKEHESIVSLEVKPYLLHAALLVIGARPGAPARFSPEFVPPSGEEIEILVRWREGDEVHQRRAQELVRQAGGGQEMSSPWVFTGGTMAKDAKGRSFYMADATGEVIGVSNFPASVLDVPFESSSDNDALEFDPFTERIPEVGTPVTLVLRRAAGSAGDTDTGESESKGE